MPLTGAHRIKCAISNLPKCFGSEKRGLRRRILTFTASPGRISFSSRKKNRYSLKIWSTFAHLCNGMGELGMSTFQNVSIHNHCRFMVFGVPGKEGLCPSPPFSLVKLLKRAPLKTDANGSIIALFPSMNLGRLLPHSQSSHCCNLSTSTYPIINRGPRQLPSFLARLR